MVSMEIKYYNFQTISHQMQVDRPTNESSVLYETACRLFQETWNGDPVRLLGIRTAKLVDETEPEQITIFDVELPQPLDEKHKKLNAAVEELNARFGKGAVIKGTFLKKRNQQKEEKNAGKAENKEKRL